MAAWLDACRFTPTLGGTTDWTYSAAVTGYNSPVNAAVVNATVYKYRAESADLSQWEEGEGAYSSAGAGVFARTTVFYNSSATGTKQSGAGTKISFSTVPQVAVVASKHDILSIEEANTFTEAQMLQGRKNLFAAPFDGLAFNGMQFNGSMEISQEAAATAVTVPVNTDGRASDGFPVTYNHAAGTAVMTVQQVTPPGSPSFGSAFQKCLQYKSTTAITAPAAGDYCVIEHRMEGYRIARLGFGNANAQPITIGFWIYATIAGTFTVAVRNGPSSTRHYLTSMTINNATTWEYKTLTVPGDQAGTWNADNTWGMVIDISLTNATTFADTAGAWAAGSGFVISGQTNFFASNNNVVCITGFGVWPGSEAPSALRSPFIMRPYDQELILAKRHFRCSFPAGTACAQNAGVAGAITTRNPIALGDPSIYVPFMPSMRASPTITTFNPSAANANWRDITAGADVTVTVDGANTSGDSGVLLGTSGTVTTLGDYLAIHYKASARL